MGFFSTIISGITKVAEFAVGTIAAAIATPTVGTVIAAVATVGAIVGGAYLIYKGVSYAVDKADQYITHRCNPDEVSTRFMLPGAKTRENNSGDDIASDIAVAVCNDTSERRSESRRYSFDDSIATIKPKKHKPKSKSKSKAREYRLKKAMNEDNYIPTLKLDDMLEKKRAKKEKKNKLSLKKMSKIAKIDEMLDELKGRPTADEYFNSLPFVNCSNITCMN